MRCAIRSLRSLCLVVGTAMPLADAGTAADPCSGHQLLRTRRAESSCTDLKPRIYPSPDGALRALVFPVDISLDATPDMESRVVIRNAKATRWARRTIPRRVASTATTC
jgi:hypothetical protein